MLRRQSLRALLAVVAFIVTAAAGWLVLLLVLVAVQGPHFGGGTDAQQVAIDDIGPVIVILLAFLAAVRAFRGLAKWATSTDDRAERRRE